MEVDQDKTVVKLGLQERRSSPAIQSFVPVFTIPLGYQTSG